MAEVTVLVLSGDDVNEQHVVDAKELEAAVDADVAQFDEYFQRELKNAPLVRSERAVLKTYLFWKTHQEKSDAGEASPAVPV